MSESPKHTDLLPDKSAETNDNKAEADFKKESTDLNTLRDTLVAKFDVGISAISDDTGFDKAFKDALNTLIQNETSRLVNVADLAELTPEKRLIINAQIKAWMVTFTAMLSGQVGYRREASDVEATKKLLSNSFKSVEPGAQKPPEPKPESLYDSFTKKVQSVADEGSKLYDSVTQAIATDTTKEGEKQSQPEKAADLVEHLESKKLAKKPVFLPEYELIDPTKPNTHDNQNKQKPRSLSLVYQEEGKDEVTMVIRKNDEFYDTYDAEKTVEGTLAYKIRENKKLDI